MPVLPPPHPNANASTPRVTLTSLAHSHSYPLLHTWQRQHRWPRGHSEHTLSSTRDMVGQRLGVLGYGSIGRHVARVCSAMGMSVIAYTAHKRTTPESKRDHGFIVPNTGDPDGSIPEAWYGGLDKESCLLACRLREKPHTLSGGRSLRS